MGDANGDPSDKNRKRKHIEDMTRTSKPKKDEEGEAGAAEEELEDELALSLSPSSHRRLRPHTLPQPPVPSSSPPPLFLPPHRPLSFNPFAGHEIHLPAPMQQNDPLHLPRFSPEPISTSVAAATAAVPGPSTSIAVSRPAPRSGRGRRKPAPRSGRGRRKPTQDPRGGKDDLVPAPFDWATDRRATFHSLAYLRSVGIRSITGEVQCKRCDSQYMIEYDLDSKFMEIENYIREHKSTMHDRAPKEWMNPKLPNCQNCGHHGCIKPLISTKKRSINWLFLLLGRMLGCCTLEQLRYFCKHTKNHRTGAKDRVLYLTYLGLCKQLDPDGPFDR